MVARPRDSPRKRACCWHGGGLVMRREGLEQETYAHLLSGVLDLASTQPLTGRLACEVQSNEGERLGLTLCFLEISDVGSRNRGASYHYFSLGNNP